MGPFSRLGPLARAYVWGVIAVGLSVIGWSVLELSFHTLPWQWFLLAVLTLISGSATVNLPSVPASISISETFVFTAFLLYGTAAGTVIVTLDGLVISFWLAKRRREFYRALFNTAAPALSAWCSAQLFFVAAGISPLTDAPTNLDRILPALLLFATTYFSLNSWLITFAIVAETPLNPIRVWREHFVWLSLNYFCGASVAFLLVSYTRDIDVHYIGVIAPLLVVLYFTFKISMARVEDANRHVQKVDRLYLSTVETLAMAIDAKDQITHGHIRRVQSYAVGLARRMGIRDETLIKAVEAAALLHDMGKLAVPEYILNKPGKLTPAQFDKMKLHASVGADILSAIDFPYPVVPIVRHHHEHWDGRGYPDGLRGTDIPIGARILAVVDCFDALTSDRPYRSKLSDVEALRIVTERRGSMYDPLIVDTFVRFYRDIAPRLSEASPLHELWAITAPAYGVASVSDYRVSGVPDKNDKVFTIHDLAFSSSNQETFHEMLSNVCDRLHKFVPFSLCVFYLYSATTDRLEAICAIGEGAPLVEGVSIAFGGRISGWVAANRETIANSDPTLDLGDIALAMTPRLQNSISTPIVAANDECVGVIAFYTGSTESFSQEQRRIVETVGLQMSRAFQKHRTDGRLSQTLHFQRMTS